MHNDIIQIYSRKINPAIQLATVGLAQLQPSELQNHQVMYGISILPLPNKIAVM